MIEKRTLLTKKKNTISIAIETRISHLILASKCDIIVSSLIVSQLIIPRYFIYTRNSTSQKRTRRDI